MTKSSMFLTLAIVGAIVPYFFFVKFFQAHGVGGDFIGALFVNGAAGGFAADVLLSSVVFWLFLFPEAARSGVSRPWLYVVINLTIGLSCALPLFLWSREKSRQPTSS